MTVDRESMLRQDEAARADEIARERYMVMLGELDYSAVGMEDGEMQDRESVLAALAWRQAIAFVLTRRGVYEDNLGGG